MTAVRVSMLNPANLLTFIRILLVPVYLWLFARGTWGSTTAALIVFVIAALTDLVDGRLARQRKEITKLGRFMDPLADKFLIPGMMKGGVLVPYFSWLVGVGPGTGISLLWLFLGIIGFAAGLGGYLFKEVRNVEAILPDHDEIAIPAEP